MIMPNWCITNYVIEGEKKELDTLHQTMKRLEEIPEPLVENGFGSSWLGCLVKELGEDPEIVYCRGSWYDMERDDETIRVNFETAWSPSYDVIQLLKREYPSLRFYYRAMEPGCQLFQKNDEEGKYFPENIWVDYNGDDIFAIDEQEALQRLKAEYGLPERFTSLNEAEEYYDEAEDEDDYLSYAEFEITTDEDDERTAALINAIRSGEITISVEDGEDDIDDEA